MVKIIFDEADGKYYELLEVRKQVSVESLEELKTKYNDLIKEIDLKIIEIDKAK